MSDPQTAIPSTSWRFQRSGLFVLVSESPPLQQYIFWFLFFGTLVLKHVLFYVFHLCLILACVEDSMQPKLALLRTDAHFADNYSQDTDSDDDPDWFVYPHNYHPRSSRGDYAHVPRWVISLFRVVSSTIRRLYVTPPEDEMLATRDLATALGQLRFWAGGGIWFLRGLVPLAVWSLVTRLSGFLIAVLPHSFAEQDKRSDTFICAMMIGIHAVVAVAYGRLWIFHIARVVARRTGFEPNLIRKHFWDSKLFHFRLFDFDLTIPVFLLVAAFSIADFVPYWYSMDLLMDTHYNEPSEERSYALLVEQPGAIHKLVRLHLVWVALRVIVVGPAFWLVCRYSAQHLHSSGPLAATIVGYQRNISTPDSKQFRPWQPHRVFNLVSWVRQTVVFARRTGWLRIARMMLQQALVFVAIFGCLAFAMHVLLHHMAHRHLIVDWILREYADLGLEATYWGKWKQLAFWVTPARARMDSTRLPDRLMQPNYYLDWTGTRTRLPYDI